jgi:hypothetical protein
MERRFFYASGHLSDAGAMAGKPVRKPKETILLRLKKRISLLISMSENLSSII